MPHDSARGAFVSGVVDRRNVMQDLFCIELELIHHSWIDAL